MTQNEAAEKIRKMLKTKGRTAAESDTAQLLAAALADKHGIDIAALDAQEEKKRLEITHKSVGHWTKIPCEALYASRICARFFEVNTIMIYGFVEEEIFVGTAWHLEIAEYVFEFLIKEFRWQWNKKRGRCKKRKDFLYGCFVALRQKLCERFAREFPSTELELSFSAKRAAYINERWPQNVTAKTVQPKGTGAAAHRGFAAGQNIEIRPGVKEGAIKPKQPQIDFFDSMSGRMLGNGGAA
jgi:hypothetical protein